jgi:glycosyltransferase involved in cell wall biosynthesis
MWMHGEPLSSVANGQSMKAIVDLAPLVDAFICMRQAELPIWSSIKRTHLITKGIDLEKYCPIPLGQHAEPKLSGEPSVLYCENWRGNRNPLYLCCAMEKVHQKFPQARLHLYNCVDKNMQETFKQLIANNKWHTFIRTLSGSVCQGGEGYKAANALYNRADINVSCLTPLYARGIEAFGAGKAFISPGYREHDYPWTCELDVASMADAIVAAWEDYQRIDYRKWALTHHDVKDTAEEAAAVYERYL